MTSEVPLTDADFALIAGLAMQDFGLHLTPTKRDLVYSRLLKRLRLLGMTSFSDYCALVTGPQGADERQAMLSALTTNVTQFFREAHHFTALRDTALPGLIRAAQGGARVRLWSAGCSAGQEAYSLAFTLLALCPEAARLNLRILATDVDPDILARAEAGLYPASELAAIPLDLQRFVDADGHGFAIGARARALVTFGRLNLIDPWPMRGQFDVILCRNVAIYFDKPTQSRLWARLGDVMAAGGHLCIGHSERLAGPAEPMFRPTGITAYQRLAPAWTHAALRSEGPRT